MKTKTAIWISVVLVAGVAGFLIYEKKKSDKIKKIVPSFAEKMNIAMSAPVNP